MLSMLITVVFERRSVLVVLGDVFIIRTGRESSNV
jgi:hypothetical protein